MAKVRFSTAPPKGDRIHYLNQVDIEVVLNRLPVELWQRLREVHFNDQSRGDHLDLVHNPPGAEELVFAPADEQYHASELSPTAGSA